MKIKKRNNEITNISEKFSFLVFIKDQIKGNLITDTKYTFIIIQHVFMSKKADCPFNIPVCQTHLKQMISINGEKAKYLCADNELQMYSFHFIFLIEIHILTVYICFPFY